VRPSAPLECSLTATDTLALIDEDVQYERMIG
jgi:hypothetical protein